MDKRALKRLDRETNQAMKRAHSVAERFAIQADARERRRRLMLGLDYEAQDGDVFSGMIEAFGGSSASLRDGVWSYTWMFEEPEEWKQAKTRAYEFFMAHLNDEQKTSVKKCGYFVTYNKTSGRAWRIRTNSTAYNVDALDKHGRVVNTFCALPSGERLPDGDVWLAQKILLETDEVEFLLRANRQQAEARYEFRMANNLAAL
jgi:hypothetical protein